MAHEYNRLAQKLTGSALLAILMCLVCLMIATPRAHAQQAAGSALSTEFMAGFAFFKFAKAKPDFITWVKNSEAYKQGTPALRSNLLRAEVSRLQYEFDNFVVSENPITIKAQVIFNVPSEAQAKRILKEKGSISIPIKMVHDTKFLFPLQVGDMWIALVPLYLEDMLSVELNTDEYELFKRGMYDYQMRGKVTTTMKLELMPRAADTKAPMRINNFDLWVLLADVMSFEIMSKDGAQMAWYMDIPGYEKHNRNQDIYNLFKN